MTWPLESELLFVSEHKGRQLNLRARHEMPVTFTTSAILDAHAFRA